MDMRLSNLFPTTKEGIQAMTLEDWVAWMKALDHWSVDKKQENVIKVHTLLTQEFREDILVRPRLNQNDGFNESLEIELWNPLFAGEWKKEGDNILIKTNPGIWCCINIYHDGNLNDFIRESTKQGIKLYFLDREI